MLHGLLAGKTRVLATHHTRYLARADRVLQLEAGRQAGLGPPAVLLPGLDPGLDTAPDTPAEPVAVTSLADRSKSPAKVQQSGRD